MTQAYEKLGFKANPFSEERFDLDMVGRHEDWTKLLKVIGDQLKGQGAGLSVIFGDYGMGKSFTLYKLQSLLQKGDPQFPAPSHLIAARFRTTQAVLPKYYIVDLFQRMMRDIGRKRIGEICSQAIKSGVDLETTFGNVVSQLAAGNENAWSWLTGRKLSASKLEQIGASYRVGDYDEIHAVFLQSLKLFKSAEIISVVLLLDELEFLLSMASRTKLLAIIHEIQSIWDDFNQLPENEKQKHSQIIFVFASSADSWQKFLELAEEEKTKKGGGGTETFLRRIPPDGRIALTPLSERDVTRLLLERMIAYRLDPNDKSMHPFRPDYVKFISRLSFGYPSRVLSWSALVLKEADSPSIGASEAEKILRDYGALLEFSEAEE